MTSGPGPLIDLVESTYRLHEPKHEWLEQLAAQARAALWPEGCAIVLSYKGVHTPDMRRNGAAIVALDEALRTDAVRLDPSVGPVLDSLVQGGPPWAVRRPRSRSAAPMWAPRRVKRVRWAGLTGCAWRTGVVRPMACPSPL